MHPFHLNIHVQDSKYISNFGVHFILILFNCEIPIIINITFHKNYIFYYKLLETPFLASLLLHLRLHNLQQC